MAFSLSEALKIPLLAQLASTHTFTIVFSGAGDLMRSKSGEGFRSILVDKHSHHVISHGLLQPSNLASVNGLLRWECATVIVGRKYRVDIDRKLSRIDSGIADIRRFLENDRIGKLQAHCKLLGDTADSLRSDPSFLFRNSTIQQSVEDAEQSASAIVRACLLDLRAIRERAGQNVSLQAVSNADLAPVSHAISEAVHTLRAASFALSLRTCCASFLTSYMDHDHLREVRLADVNTLWRQVNDESKALQVVIRDKIDTLSEVLSFETTVQAKKELAKSESCDSFQLAALALRSAEDDADVAMSDRSLLEAGDTPIELTITLSREGKILTSRLADRSATA
jgi:hypothetical protein